ncbi:MULTISPECIES: efflux RND transporter periplasmic adaptor subunit [Bizionia]|uniref:Efflux RND transporter periplasmic adaptor subunit n=1 Tax=Bizionia algoritergicola TaxID=291187 RepID=A0A5D0QZZ1_9FLAO|nr:MULTISPECIES: efflux RND transporter periplasmic adaptor subunit [Bizionia]OBX21802.1 efflux transporter periplasmic adaptor subunit [Bizionia sp. APA-3]TYB74852.1 efflux RND transporter periplasmic adaptor subunit [Bizionia algoritergicola]
MKYIYILLFSALFIACGNSENEPTDIIESVSHEDEIKLSEEQFKSEAMVLGALSQRTFDETVTINGAIDVPPHNKSRVTTYMAGYITKTPLLVGDQVKKGQLLVTLENTEYIELQQQFLEIAEQLNYLKNEYTRQKTLFDENITSEKNYLKAESMYKSNLAFYNGLEKKLQMLNINPKSVLAGNMSSTINIYAPINGHVTKVNVSNGAFVSASDEIMEIVDIDHIHLELSVFEKDIMKIKKGQKITFTIPEASEKTYNADVHLVGTTIDNATRRVQVHGHIDDVEENFIIGMFVEAQIHINEVNALALPQEAVIQLDNNYYVLVLEEKTASGYVFEKTKVKIGKQTEDYMEILNPETLLEKQIITHGTSMLLNESEGGHGH